MVKLVPPPHGGIILTTGSITCGRHSDIDTEFVVPPGEVISSYLSTFCATKIRNPQKLQHIKYADCVVIGGQSISEQQTFIHSAFDKNTC